MNDATAEPINVTTFAGITGSGIRAAVSITVESPVRVVKT
jgi:hypothetical protein